MTKNILLLVEGERTECDFFNKMGEIMFGGVNIKIISFKCNIYSLYKFMEEYEFNIDLIKALTLKKNLLKEEEIEFIKENKFFMKFLIFDFDFQEKYISDSDKVIRLQKMRSFFIRLTFFLPDDGAEQGSSASMHRPVCGYWQRRPYMRQTTCAPGSRPAAG